MGGGEQEGQCEEGRLNQHHHGPGGAIKEVAGIDADEAADGANHGGNDDDVAESVRQQVGGGPRRDDQRNDQEGPHRLHGGHGAGSQQREEDQLHRPRVQAHAACMGLIEEDDQQILPLQQQHGQRDGADDDQLQHVARRDGQDVAQHDGLDVDARGRDRHHEEPQPEEGAEDQADDHIGLQTGVAVEKTDGTGGHQPGKECTGREGQSQHVGTGHPGHDRMR